MAGDTVLMAHEYLERQRFPPPGECIYCGARGDGVELTDEHIIPFSLGGNVEIVKASCKPCAQITGDLEFHVGRKVLWDYRLHAGIQTRRPKERPDTLPARVSVAFGPEQVMELPIQDHPYFTAMPIWGMPGLLCGTQASAQFEHEKAHLFYYIPPNIRETLNLRDGELAEIMAPDIKIDSYKFARAIAKMAYCQTVVRYGLSGFRRLAIQDLILGKYPLVPYFVGCELKDPPPPGDRKGVHFIDTREVTIGRMRLIVGSVRLFAHSGTPENGMPIYRVVVGAPKPSAIGETK
jgi:hypothetical protein